MVRSTSFSVFFETSVDVIFETSNLAFDLASVCVSQCDHRDWSTAWANAASSNDVHLISLEYEASQTAGCVGAGIYVDAVRSNVDFFAWRMAVDHNLLELPIMEQELVADPKQIVLALLCERNPRPCTGVGKEIVPTCKR